MEKRSISIKFRSRSRLKNKNEGPPCKKRKLETYQEQHNFDVSTKNDPFAFTDEDTKLEKKSTTRLARRSRRSTSDSSGYPGLWEDTAEIKDAEQNWGRVNSHSEFYKEQQFITSEPIYLEKKRFKIKLPRILNNKEKKCSPIPPQATPPQAASYLYNNLENNNNNTNSNSNSMNNLENINNNKKSSPKQKLPNDKKYRFRVRLRRETVNGVVKYTPYQQDYRPPPPKRKRGRPRKIQPTPFQNYQPGEPKYVHTPPQQPICIQARARVKSKSPIEMQRFANLPITYDDLQAQGVSEFRLVSVRQPWAEALLEGYKKIENRNYPIPEYLGDSWFGLYVSQKFGPDERSFTGWPGRSSDEKLKESCGKLIGLLKFENRSLSVQEATQRDNFFTNYPVRVSHYWHCVDRIKLPVPVEVPSNVRWTRVNDASIRKYLQDILFKERGVTQPILPIPKISEKKVFDCNLCNFSRSKRKALEEHYRREHPEVNIDNHQYLNRYGRKKSKRKMDIVECNPGAKYHMTRARTAVNTGPPPLPTLLHPQQLIQQHQQQRPEFYPLPNHRPPPSVASLPYQYQQPSSQAPSSNFFQPGVQRPFPNSYPIPPQPLPNFASQYLPSLIPESQTIKFLPFAPASASPPTQQQQNQQIPTITNSSLLPDFRKLFGPSEPPPLLACKPEQELQKRRHNLQLIQHQNSNKIHLASPPSFLTSPNEKRKPPDPSADIKQQHEDLKKFASNLYITQLANMTELNQDSLPPHLKPPSPSKLTSADFPLPFPSPPGYSSAVRYDSEFSSSEEETHTPPFKSANETIEKHDKSTNTIISSLPNEIVISSESSEEMKSSVQTIPNFKQSEPEYDYPCCINERNRPSICCDTCDEWWHNECLMAIYGFSKAEIDELTQNEQSKFKCPNCKKKEDLEVKNNEADQAEKPIINL